MVTAWLTTGMFKDDTDATAKAAKIVGGLGSHAETRSHGRHIHVSRLQELGVEIVALEVDPDLQDAVLSVHHACMLSFAHTPAVKIIENQNGVSAVTLLQILQQPVAPGPQPINLPIPAPQPLPPQQELPPEQS
jgi:hypothetical protein